MKPDRYTFFEGASMNTKSLTLATAFSALTAISTMAATYTITVATGLNFIANELNNPGGNSVATLLGSPSGHVTVFKWNKVAQNYIQTVYDPDAGGWSNPAMTLNPGEGAVLDNPSGALTMVTFTGAVPAPPPPIVIGPCQACLLGDNDAVGPSTYADIVGAAPVDGTALVKYTGVPVFTSYLFVNGAWHQFVGGAWVTVADPMVALGESVFVVGAPPPATISTGMAAAPCPGNQKKITWTGPAVLLSSPSLAPGAVWTPVAGATSPYCAAPGGGANFFRVACPLPGVP